jgi:hypothetical protein
VKCKCFVLEEKFVHHNMHCHCYRTVMLSQHIFSVFLFFLFFPSIVSLLFPLHDFIQGMH